MCIDTHISFSLYESLLLFTYIHTYIQNLISQFLFLLFLLHTFIRSLLREKLNLKHCIVKQKVTICNVNWEVIKLKQIYIISSSF